MKKVVIKFIKVYQRLFSPFEGIFGYGCRFYPSCSRYAEEAIDKNGILKGGLGTMWRIFRCGPWSKGGIDRV